MLHAVCVFSHIVPGIKAVVVQAVPVDIGLAVISAEKRPVILLPRSRNRQVPAIFKKSFSYKSPVPRRIAPIPVFQKCIVIAVQVTSGIRNGKCGGMKPFSGGEILNKCADTQTSMRFPGTVNEIIPGIHFPIIRMDRFPAVTLAPKPALNCFRIAVIDF